MFLGTLSALFTVGNLILAGLIILPEVPPERMFTSGAHLKAIVLEQEEIIDVSITYHLQKDPGSTQISYRGIRAFDTEIRNVSVIFNTTELILTPSVDELNVSGQIDIPESLAPDSSFTLMLKYELSSSRQTLDEQFDIPIPLLWIENSNPASTKRFFNAHLVLPEEYYVNESFPGNVVPCYSNGDPRHNCVNMQVLPTFIRFRGLIGQNPGFTALKVLDYGILLLLTFTCIYLGFLLVKRQQRPAFST